MSINFLRSVVESLGDPALVGRWVAVVRGPGTLSVSNKPILVESIGVSTVKVGSVQRQYGGFQYDFPSTAQTDPTSVVFYEYDDMSITKWLEDWCKKIYDPSTEEYGVPIEYRKDIDVFFYPVDSNMPILKVTMEDCWPMDRTSIELNYTTPDGKLQVTCQFVVGGCVLRSV